MKAQQKGRAAEVKAARNITVDQARELGEQDARAELEPAEDPIALVFRHNVLVDQVRYDHYRVAFKVEAAQVWVEKYQKEGARL